MAPNVGATMRAYHGNPAIKAKYLARVRGHRAADEIIHGTYWENGRGCAVGCTVHSNAHAAYETELGVPRVLARLEDGIFENLSNGYAKDWPVEFLEAIPVGADLSMVFPQFIVWLLGDPKYGVLQYAKTKQQRKVIQDVVDAYQRVLTAGVWPPKDENWRSLRANAAYAADAAAYAAANAAYAAADAADAAANAAYAAADAAAYAAANAADAAADAAANAARKYAHGTARKRQAHKLLDLLRAAPCG